MVRDVSAGVSAGGGVGVGERFLGAAGGVSIVVAELKGAGVAISGESSSASDML